MTDLRELEKRLEEATGGSEDLNIEILHVLHDHGGFAREMVVVPNFTGSLDAAVALVERVLPSNRDDGRVWLQLLDDAVTTALASDAKPNNMARLVCLALIRTLIAKGDRHD